MKKFVFVFILALIIGGASLVLFSCGARVQPAANEFSQSSLKGEIGEFWAVSPIDNEEDIFVPEFTWTAAKNAESYMLEIASTEDFDPEDRTYFKKAGIAATSFRISAALKTKDQTYYWRVTASNLYHSALFSDGVQSFYYKANDQEEVSIDFSYADEWKVHEDGSEATVFIDKTDFFNNGKDALAVRFDKEDTDRGEEFDESNGWIVVTHGKETEFYGVDAFYFDFYYAGNDSEVWFRVVDEDDEYWHVPLKVASNAKQTIIVRFDEFSLRTKGGTMVQNRVFDYNYVKSFELVFEKSFGDGICYFSDLRAIRYDNYSDLFISSVDFRLYENAFVLENYNFGVTVSEDGSQMTYAFSGAANELNSKGIQGYGFVKMNVEKLLAAGDAIELELSFTSPQNFSGADVLIRLVEEDGDRWVYSERVSELTGGGKLLIPFNAFSISEDKGDGLRQFAYVKALQFGIRNAWSGGAVTVSGVRVASLKNEVEAPFNLSVSGGSIDDFSYPSSLEMYYRYIASSSNRGEEMKVSSDSPSGEGRSGAFGYKTDMGEAEYSSSFDPQTGFNELRFFAKDASEGGAAAHLTITLFTETGETYSYSVAALSNEWREYIISFADMRLADGFFGAEALSEESSVAGISFTLEYEFYKTVLGVKVASPKYVNDLVYFCDLRLALSGEEE